MIASITPSAINGNITIPASKSAMQRACALALLNNGRTIIKNPGKSNDDLAAIRIITAMGADVKEDAGKLIIDSTGRVKGQKRIDCGESGLSFRMFASIAALADTAVVLEGEGSLRKRPMHFPDNIFPLLGVSITSSKGFLPVTINGPIKPQNITIDGSLSSQYLTGLLFAFAKASKNRVTITVTNLKSKPYIDLSLQMLGHFGYKVSHQQYREFFIEPFNAEERDVVYNVEGDWSSASFMLVAGAIAGSVSISGLEINSVQADKAIIEVLVKCGASVSLREEFVTVSTAGSLEPFDFDATDCPDLFPPLVVLAAECKGTSYIKGVSRLEGKESSRAETLMENFVKMGIEISLQGDKMVIRGGTGIKAARVSSHHDHRIAMACAVAGLKADGNIVITDAGAVDKSYPEFYDQLKMLGASMLFSEQ